MIYYRRNKSILEEFQNKEDRELLVYPDAFDIRNYAFTILYGNSINSFEQVLRTKDLKNHYLAMKLLWEKSCYLKKYVSKRNASCQNMENCNDSLMNTGNCILLNMSSNYLEDIGAVLYLPYQITPYMKTFLNDRIASLTLFPDMSIYQATEEKNVEVLCEAGEKIYQDVLKKILK